MSIELKPCPFCGGEASINDDPTGNGGKPIMRGRVGLGRLWSVECDECGADAGYWQEEWLAVRAWNTRTEMTCRDESGGDPCAFVCSHCGSVRNHPEDEPIAYCPNCGAKVVEG